MIGAELALRVIPLFTLAVDIVNQSINHFDSHDVLKQIYEISAILLSLNNAWSLAGVKSRSTWRSNTALPPKRTMRTVLPLLLNGHKYNAITDTGSNENAMSESFALSIGIDLSSAATSNSKSTFTNARGERFSSRCSVVVEWSFQDSKNLAGLLEFHIIPDLAVSVLVGQQFIDANGIFTLHRHQLRRVAREPDAGWKVLHMQVPNRRLVCSVDKNFVLANADTGSDIDLVSLKYAQARSWKIIPIRRDERFVELADGSIARLSGKIVADLTIEAQLHREHTFYVLEGLSSDVLLGDTTLQETEAFTENDTNFVELPGEGNTYDMNLIIWRRNIKAEKKQSFEEELELWDLAEQDRRTNQKRHIQALPPTEQMYEQRLEYERQRRYNLCRAEMIRLRRLLTDDEILHLPSAT